MRAFLALGSNLGDREANLKSAIEHLRLWHGISVLDVSSFHQTEPVGPPQPPFLNAACAVETTLSPRELLNAMLEIEARHGRERSMHWGPRTLDLDLLLYGDAVINEPDLTVPHPRMHERLFVLEPLCEIAPDVRHPVLNLTIRQLLQRLKEKKHGGYTR